MRIPALADALNRASGDFEIGRLHEIRTRLRSLKRAPSRGLFNPQTVHDNYAFHVGGRKELQFNIGEEERDGLRAIRFGLAFSLEPSQTLPSIAPLVPKIARFNDFVRSHAEDFPGFRMWHYTGEMRSEDRPVGPIPDELVVAGNFIVLGRWVPDDEVDIREILTHFDLLIPLYVFVETGSHTPAAPDDSDFEPGCPDFVLSTKVSLTERTLDVALRHKALQQALYKLLRREAGPENVQMERRLSLGILVDAAVRNNEKFTFYEVKVAPTVQSCVRAALGQLLEYAYWPSADRANELIIVGELALDSDAAAYLHFLRERFGLPIWYRRLDMDRNVLEEKS